MIRKIELSLFKCFDLLKLPLAELTLLSGTNASGKSSFLQSLVLLNQTILENESSQRLILNGNILKLGTVQDVVNKVHGRQEFSLVIVDDDSRHEWVFSGQREEMSMSVRYISDVISSAPLRKLIPSSDSYIPPICNTLESLTYITAERIGPKDYYLLEDRNLIQTVGSKGEYAVSILYRFSGEIVESAITIDDIPPILMRQVEAWMNKFFPGCGIEVTPISRMNAVTLGVRNSDETDYHRPINVGFGLTQILPILVAVLSARPNDLILIENPEVHLHPAGQALMGSFLAQAASSGIQIILETHSDHLLNGIRRAVSRKVLTPEQVALHFFRNSKSGLDHVVSPQLDANGSIDSWPEDFFDQYDKDMNYFAGWGD